MDGPVDHHHVLWMAWVRSEREEDGAQFLSEWGAVGKERKGTSAGNALLEEFNESRNNKRFAEHQFFAA